MTWRQLYRIYDIVLNFLENMDPLTYKLSPLYNLNY